MKSLNKFIILAAFTIAAFVSCNNIDPLNAEIESQLQNGEHDSRLSGWWFNSNLEYAYTYYDTISFEMVCRNAAGKSFTQRWYTENDNIMHEIYELPCKYYYSRKGYTGILDDMSYQYRLNERGDSLFAFDVPTQEYYLHGVRSEAPQRD